MNIDRIYSAEAEISVLSSILMDGDSIFEVIEFLDAEDFYNLKNKIIYKTIKDMYQNRTPVDIVTLSEKLGDRLKEVGGITYISEIANGNVTTANVRKHGEIIKEKANTRKLLRIFNSSIEKLQKGESTLEELIDYAQNSILNIRNVDIKENGNMGEIMTNFMNILQVRYEKGGDVQGIKIGYKSLDKMLGGLLRGDLIILAARPSMGKTAMAINILLNAVFKGQAKIAFFNLEMTIAQVIDRAISAQTAIPMINIKSAALTEEQWSRISKEASIFAASNIKIYGKILTLSGIVGECKKLKIKEGLDIVIIDYLQLMDSGERAENRTQDISKITRSLKLMAKEMDITLITLSQLSRAPEVRNDHRPVLSDLRESGSIEQDADVVMFLYRDEYYHRNSESKGIIECIVAKNRNGEVGTVRLRWNPEVQRIV